jgi:hypothetical protein
VLLKERQCLFGWPISLEACQHHLIAVVLPVKDEPLPNTTTTPGSLNQYLPLTLTLHQVCPKTTQNLLAILLLTLTLHQVCHCILIVSIQNTSDAIQLPLVDFHISKHADLQTTRIVQGTQDHH